MNNSETDNVTHGLNLSDLQRECAIRFAMTPSATLDAAQVLYELTAISYPRTDFRFFLSSEHQLGKVTLANLATMSPEWKDLVEQADPDYVSSAWVSQPSTTDWYWYGAIQPLKTADITKFNEDERNVFSVIAERYIAIFNPEKSAPKNACITEEEFEYRFFLPSRQSKEVKVGNETVHVIGPSFFIDKDNGNIWFSVSDHVTGHAWLEIPLSQLSDFIVSMPFETTADFARNNMELLKKYVELLNSYVFPNGGGLYVCAPDVFETRNGVRYYKWPRT